MIKRSIVLTAIAIGLFVSSPAQAQETLSTDWRIEIDWKDLTDSTVLLAHYFADKQYAVDTAEIDANGKLVFEGTDSLRYGMYLVYLPGVTYFDIVVAEPEIKFSTALSDPVGQMEIEKSEENRVFFDYIKFIGQRRAMADQIQKQLQFASEERKAELNAQREEVDQQVRNYIDSVTQTHPDFLVSKVIRANQQIEVPDPPRDENGALLDSAFQFNYYYRHFWDNVDLSDARLLYTPLLEPRLKQYITQYTPQIPDSVMAAADRVVALTDGNQETFRYVVNWIANHYETSKLMTSESVFVHMVKNYYTADQAWWMNAADLYRIQDRAKRLEPVLIGKKIPNLVIKDQDGTYRNLHKSEADYMVLFFYDPTCGHCKKAAPIMEALRQKVAGESVEFWGIALDVENNPGEWESFIEDKDLLAWVNVANSENSTQIKLTYDIRSTPTIYVVDKNKEIIIRRIGAEQLGQVLQDIIKRDKRKAEAGTQP